MPLHPNAALLRHSLEDGFQKGDFAVLAETMPPDIVWHEPGDSRIAGDHKGRDAVFAFFAKMMELTGGTFRVAATDIAASDTSAVLVARATGARNGETLASDEVVVMRVAGGRIVEATHYIYDLPAWDRFWS